MYVCSFGKIVGLIQKHLLYENLPMNSQTVVSLLFKHWETAITKKDKKGKADIEEDETELDYIDPFDASQVSRWTTGKRKIPSKIVRYYSTDEGMELLTTAVKDIICNNSNNADLLIKEIETLLHLDPTISPVARIELCANFPLEKKWEQAEFIASVIILTIDEKKRLSAQREPITKTRLTNTRIPSANMLFVGRESEMEGILRLLTVNKEQAIVLHGKSLIGKSELVKAFVDKYDAMFSDCVWLDCNTGIETAVMNMTFANDLISSSEEEQLQERIRFLQALDEEVLLVLDNCETENTCLQEILQSKAHILITRKTELANCENYPIGPLPKDELIKLIGLYYPEAQEYQDEMETIIQLALHVTGMIVIMTKLLLFSGLTPKEFVAKLPNWEKLMSQIKTLYQNDEKEQKNITASFEMLKSFL